MERIRLIFIILILAFSIGLSAQFGDSTRKYVSPEQSYREYQEAIQKIEEWEKQCAIVDAYNSRIDNEYLRLHRGKQSGVIISVIGVVIFSFGLIFRYYAYKKSTEII